MFSFFKKRRKRKKEDQSDPSPRTESPERGVPDSKEPVTATSHTDTAASASDNQPVKIYSLSTCSHCKATKKFLSDCTIKYEFIDVDLLKGDERKAILEDVKKFNPKCSFPTIVIGEKVIIGYVEEEIKEALGL